MSVTFHINPFQTFSYSSFVDIQVFHMYDESQHVQASLLDPQMLVLGEQFYRTQAGTIKQEGYTGARSGKDKNR